MLQAFYIVGGILLIAVLLIGNDEGGSMGARRWIDIGPLNLQPSEVAKLALIIFFAYSMERDGKKMNTFQDRYHQICGDTGSVCTAYRS